MSYQAHPCAFSTRNCGGALLVGAVLCLAIWHLICKRIISEDHSPQHQYTNVEWKDVSTTYRDLYRRLDTDWPRNSSQFPKLLLHNLPGINITKDYDSFFKTPNIMCLLFTTPEKYNCSARAVNDTWAKRCDIHRWFISSDNIGYSPDVVHMSVPEGHKHLTAKTNFALQYAHANYIENVDWFLKADDDSYVIMESLKVILSFYDPKKPYYIGYEVNTILPHHYNSGGAGYVISSAALRLVVEEGHKYPTQCIGDGPDEDVDIGRCLAAFSIYPTDTLDYSRRMTFHSVHPYKILNQEAIFGEYTYRKYGGHYPEGKRVLSPFTVSFHHVPPATMYMYDFLLYDLQRPHHLIRS